jgi:hypothetical protein
MANMAPALGTFKQAQKVNTVDAEQGIFDL